MFPLTVGLILAVAGVSVAAIVLGRRDQRARWWRWQAHHYAHPEANEPSEEYFVRQGAGLQLLGLVGLVVAAGIFLNALAPMIERTARADSGLDRMLAALEAEPVRVSTRGMTLLGVEDGPASTVRELLGQERTGLRVVAQRVEEADRRFALDLDGPGNDDERCLRLVATSGAEMRTGNVDGITVYYGWYAALRAEVVDGPCATV